MTISSTTMIWFFVEWSRAWIELCNSMPKAQGWFEITGEYSNGNSETFINTCRCSRTNTIIENFISNQISNISQRKSRRFTGKSFPSNERNTHTHAVFEYVSSCIIINRELFEISFIVYYPYLNSIGINIMKRNR